MTFQFTGKNIDIGDALRDYISGKLDEVIEKYVSTPLSGHIRIEKERGQFHVDCSLQLRSGLSLQSHGESADAYVSADEAIERLEKRLRRHKRRLKDHHSRHENNRHGSFDAFDYVLQHDDHHEDHEPAQGDEKAPVIIAETKIQVDKLSVGDAVMRMDLSNQPFLVFKNASNGQLNIVYTRKDGNIGWIDPSQDA